MRLVEIKGNADLRVVAITLAHKVGVSSLCTIITDDVAFTRIGEHISKRVYRCDDIYVVIIPELFAATDLEVVKQLIEAGVAEIRENTGDDIETCLLCWSNDIETDFEHKTAVSMFRTGMSTREEAGYSWTEADTEDTTGDTTKYVVFYDKKLYRSVSYEKTEKVLVSDAETKNIREMEQTGRFKGISGGFNAIANDIATKQCGVYSGN